MIGSIKRTLYLVRHGETTGGSKLRFYGSTDVPLAIEGREQMRELRSQFEGVKPVALFHSPMLRAVESLAILAMANDWPEPGISIPDFREVDFGVCEGLTSGEIEQAFPEFFFRWQSSGNYSSFPEGENLEQFRVRVARAMDHVLQTSPAGDLVILVHKGVIRRILWHLFGREEVGLRDFDPPLASLTVVTVEGNHGLTLISPKNKPGS